MKLRSSRTVATTSASTTSKPMAPGLTVSGSSSASQLRSMGSIMPPTADSPGIAVGTAAPGEPVWE